MANIKIEYFSEALHRRIGFDMLIPNDLREKSEYSDRPMKTLFLLHGYTGNAENWVPAGLPEKYNFAIVMPNAENSFYLNGLSTGHSFQDLVGVEIVQYVRNTFGLAMKPEDTCIAGLSMGGFGALHTGLAYPETFGKIGALSSALIVHGIAHMKPEDENPVANYAYYHECFGDLETVEERDVNPEVLARKLKAEGKKIPEIYMCCGTEDSLLEANRQMHKFLQEQGIDHEYHEGPGKHDMIFWTEYITKIVHWMFA